MNVQSNSNSVQSSRVSLNTLNRIRLTAIKKGGYTNYQCTVSGHSKQYQLSIMPIYRAGTSSLLDKSGSVRIEICEIRKNDWMLYRLAYTNIVKSNRNLGSDVVYELSNALARLGLISRYKELRLEFKEDNALRSISAI